MSEAELFFNPGFVELVPLLSLSCASFFAWTISTLAGGGSPFILIPLVNLLLGASAVPPVITIGLFLGNAHRVFLFWKDIHWELTRWYAPGAIAGAILGAYAFTRVHLEWLQLFIGAFLIVSIAWLRSDSPNPPPQNSPANSPLKAWHILPAAFCKAFISGLVGTTGPILNPFYLHFGLEKEQMVATKAAHMTVIHLVKILTYGALGVLSFQNITAGLAIGLVAIPANLVGKHILAKMTAQQFRKVVLAMMLVSGLWMLWGQRGAIGT